MCQAQTTSGQTRQADARVARAGKLRIGISGWTYQPWRGVFYPPQHPQKRELEYASRQLSLCLRERLGPILRQFTPNFSWNETRFRAFFRLLPRDTIAAAKLSKLHNEKLKGRAWTETDALRPLRYAVEIRHPSFLVPEFFALLRAHQIAFVFADTAAKWPYAEELTADFVYCHLYGDEQLYVSGYGDKALAWWARRIRLWRRGLQPNDAKLVCAGGNRAAAPHDVFVYFDNDAKVHAPFDAQRLAALLA